MSGNQQAVHKESKDVRFEDFGLAPEILRALSDQGYVTPTPIQVQAIPVVMQGRDVMGIAQTGTGKTAGFSLPVIQALLPQANTSMSPARHPVRALILTPTRELADQVAESVKSYLRHTALRSTVVFGGVDINTQAAALEAGVEILIATPGRLLDHVQKKSLNLSQTHILILDEADRMLDMGFMPDLQRIVGLLPKQRQSLLFSATFSNEIKKLASTFLNNPVTVEVARINKTADKVTQTVYRVDEADKNEAVIHLLRSRALKQVLVFTNTRVGASRLTRRLQQENIKATAIHGDKSQPERMAALEAFKQGDVDVLVATDVAARGLDIVELPCVINYDLPFNAEDYVHRIGRTGRAGASGDAISLCTHKEERFLADIEKLTGQKFERISLPDFRGAVHGNEDRPTKRRDKSYSQSSEHKRSERSPYKSIEMQRKQKEEAWVSQPYVPSRSAPDSSDSHPRSHSASKQPKKKLAALLGGVKKHSS